MERRMESLEVFMNKSNTVSIQQDRDRDDPAIVTIHPDQVDTLIKWLQEVRAEILEDGRD